MKFRNISLIFRKELTDVLRDRRTLITSILLPLLLFPVMILTISVIAFFVTTRAARENPSVMLLGREHAPELSRRIETAAGIDVVPEADDFRKQINEKELRVAVQFPEAMEAKLRQNPGQPQPLTLYFYDDEFRSERIARRVEEIVRDYNLDHLRGQLQSKGLTEEAVTPFVVKKENVASAERVTGNIVGLIMPYFIIILCLTGAMYPAIDLTAGEKERGTMETILTSPVSRMEIVGGKFLLVLLASLTTSALAVLSFSLTVLGGAQLLQRISAKLTLAVSVKAAASVVLLVLPLAFLFSAVLMAVAVVARNYREAQGYVGPLFMVVILPALASMIPGIELNARLALVPVLNVALVTKEVFAGNYPWGFIGIILGTTLLYALAALAFAARQFNKESVLFRV